MADTPSIPMIDSGQQSQIPSVAAILSQAGIGQNIPIPAATQVQNAPNPHLPVNQAQAPIPMQRPMSGDAMDRKRARNANNWSSVANSINSYSSRLAERHIETVKQDVTTLMNAQQQINNADQILNAPKGTYSDKDVQNATEVKKKNVGVTERILSDPKRRKSAGKAFDVSFTDPSKNDTPEVKAMVAARKEFETSKNSGLNVDNPAEKRVQDLANGTGQAATSSQQNTDAAHASGLKVRGVDAPSQPQAVSYAQQFLNQQPKELAQNPAYIAAMKQREEQQKNAVKLATPIINAQAAGDRNAANNAQKAQAVKDNNARALQVGRERNATLLKATYARTSAEIQKTRMQITSREKVAFNKGTSPKDQATILTGNVTKITSDIGRLVSTNTSLEAQKSAILAHKDGAKEVAALTELDRQINENKATIQDFNGILETTNTRLGELEKGGVDVTSIPRGQQKTDGPTESTTDGNSTGSDESNDELSDLE